MLLCRTAADSCVRIKCKAVQCITSIVCSPWQKVSVFSGSMAKPSSPLSHSTDKTASPSAIPPKRADAPPRLRCTLRCTGAALSVYFTAGPAQIHNTDGSVGSCCLLQQKEDVSLVETDGAEHDVMLFFPQPPQYLHGSAVCFDWPELPATASERLLSRSTRCCSIKHKYNHNEINSGKNIRALPGYVFLLRQNKCLNLLSLYKY